MIDPLDGTKEFLEGTGEFTVNIALIVEAEAVLGLIAAPNRGHLDFGVPDWGARRYPLFSEEEGEDLSTRVLDPTGQLVMSASARHREERVQMMLTRLADIGGDCRQLQLVRAEQQAHRRRPLGEDPHTAQGLE